MFTAHRERYKSNNFKQNEDKDSDEGNTGVKNYIYYIRPFVPFWRIQNLSFEHVISLGKIPLMNEGTYPRYVLHDLVKTWVGNNPDDKWFDREDVWDWLKDDVISRIQSTICTKPLPCKYEMNLILILFFSFFYSIFPIKCKNMSS